MAGYHFIRDFRDLEEEINRLGFMFSYPKHGNSYNGDYRDMVAIKPKDQDSLPIYSRDAELFVGSIEELKFWVKGVKWSRDYDRMLFGKKHEANRERKEQIHRNEAILTLLKQSEPQSN